MRFAPTLQTSTSLAVLAVVLMLPSLGFAQESDLGQDKPPALDEIVVVGSPDKLQDIAGSAAVISQEDLERARVFTTVEALRQVAGVFVREEEGLGIRPNIGIRGLSPVRSTKVLLLEDGIPLGYAPYGDNAAYYHPPIDRFARIEVLKGAAQVRFGPQTIGGVINYITPRAPETPQAKISLSAGNEGYLELDATGGAPALGGRILLHINRKESNGNRENQDLELTDIYAKGEWDLSETQSLTLRASIFQEDSQVTYSGLTRAEFAANPRGNPFTNDTFDTERWSAALSHGWQISDGIDLRTTAYYHYFDRDWWRQSSNSGQRPNDSSDPLCGGMANLQTSCGNEGRLRTYDTFGIESRLSFAHAGGQTEVGVRIHRELQDRFQINGDTPNARTPGTSVNAGVRENNRRTTWAYSGFVQSELTFGALGIKPGVRVELVDYERQNRPTSLLSGGRPTGALTTPTQGSADVDKVIPGLGLTYKVRDDVTVYGGVHRGFAPPRVEDIITTAGGAVDLDAELSWNYELGVRGTLAPGFSVDFTLYQMDFSNQVVPASVAGGVGATLTSAGKTQHRGLELSGRYSSREAGLTQTHDIFARTAITWTERAIYKGSRRASGCAPGQATISFEGVAFSCDVGGNRLPYSPEWMFSAAVGAQVGWATGLVEVQYQSGMFADDVNSVRVTADGQRGRIDGWTQVNATLNITPPDSVLSGYISIKNLFDKLYVVDRVRGILPGTPRLFQAGVTVSF
jgi:Fe(3+) dicitrate transport protein